MRKFKKVQFDTFDGMQQEATAQNYLNDNVILQQLQSDTGQDVEGLFRMLSQYFPNYINPDLPITENINLIYNNLKAKKDAGENLTSVESIIFEAVRKAKMQIDATRKVETRKAVLENLPLILIVVFAAFLIVKK